MLPVTILCRLVGAALSLGGAAALTSFSTLAEERECQCHFSQSPWDAYGTKAACAAWTRDSGESCEIEFGGLGADPDLIAKVLNRDPSEYFSEVYDVLLSYIASLRENDTAALTDPEFLQAALPIFMRGAFLRDQLDQRSIEELTALNQLIETFIKELSVSIGQVFRGEAEPFGGEIEDHKYTVGRGWIVLEYNGGILATSYMPGSQPS